MIFLLTLEKVASLGKPENCPKEYAVHLDVFRGLRYSCQCIPGA